MAKKRKPRDLKDISLTPLLYFGLVLIVVGVVLSKLFPNLPEIVTTIVYLIGMLALIVYMWQCMYERRTGKKEKDGETQGNRLSGRK